MPIQVKSAQMLYFWTRNSGSTSHENYSVHTLAMCQTHVLLNPLYRAQMLKIADHQENHDSMCSHNVCIYEIRNAIFLKIKNKPTLFYNLPSMTESICMCFLLYLDFKTRFRAQACLFPSINIIEINNCLAYPLLEAHVRLLSPVDITAHIHLCVCFTSWHNMLHFKYIYISWFGHCCNIGRSTHLSILFFNTRLSLSLSFVVTVLELQACPFSSFKLCTQLFLIFFKCLLWPCSFVCHCIIFYFLLSHLFMQTWPCKVEAHFLGACKGTCGSKGQNVYYLTYYPSSTK